MKRKNLFLSLILLAALGGLAACSNTAAPTTNPLAADSGAPASDPAQGTPMPGGPGEMPVTAKLGAGTLLLEDTEWKIDAAQAAQLLPLWKTVKALSASETSSADEISAVFEQIQETMTADQISAIESMQLGGDQMAALAEKYGIQGGPRGGMPGGDMPDLSEDERATRVAELRASGGGRGQGGGQMPPGGGGFPSGGPQGGEFPGGGGFDPNNSAAQGTPDPNISARRSSLGMNSQYLDAVIKLLEERAKE